MYIEIVPNRHSRPAVLLREGKREGNKVVKRTLANLTDWPKDRVEALRAVLKGARAAQPLEESFDVVRSRPHGHVAAVLSTLRRVGMERLLGTRRPRERDVAVAMIDVCVLERSFRMVTARGPSKKHLRQGVLVLYDLTSTYHQNHRRQFPYLAQRPRNNRKESPSAQGAFRSRLRENHSADPSATARP